jgi:hypothetical protein
VEVLGSRSINRSNTERVIARPACTRAMACSAVQRLDGVQAANALEQLLLLLGVSRLFTGLHQHAKRADNGLPIFPFLELMGFKGSCNVVEKRLRDRLLTG